MRKKLLPLFATLMITGFSAYSAELYDPVSGLYFDKINNTTDVSVSAPPDGQHYSGSMHVESSVEIEGRTYTVKEIGRNAFAEASTYTGARLTAIDIDNSITSIEDGAFSGCNKLASINIPNRTTYIGVGAFENCTSLATVTLSNYLTQIKDRAFSNCPKLAHLEITSRVTTIGDQAFMGCTTLADVNFPSGLKSIGISAFENCQAITDVTLGDAVTSIGESAFSGCKTVRTLTLPSYIAEIKANTFNGCSSITKVTIPSSVNEIGDQAFAECSALTLLTFESASAAMRIGTNVFKGTALESVTLGRTLNCTSTATGVFQDLQTLKNVTTDKNVTKLPDSVFRSCKSLANVSIESGLVEIGSRAFQDCTTLTSLRLPSSVSIIKSNAFYNCYRLSDFTLPENVTTVDTQAFYQCRALPTISLPNVTEIKASAFYGCDQLNNITLSDKLVTIGNDVFSDCLSLSSITIPGSVTTIGSGVFFGCPKLTSVTFGEGVQLLRIGDQLFTDCPIREFTLGRNTEYAGSSDETIFSSNTTLHDVKILNSVSRIADRLFANCTALSEIVFPSSITRIGDKAFENCTGISAVTCNSETPPTAYASTFSASTYSNATLTVPAECSAAYGSATCWKSFKSLKEQPGIPKYNVSVKIFGPGTVSINGATFTSNTLHEFQIKQGEQLIILTEPNEGARLLSANYSMGDKTVSFTTSATITVTADVTAEITFDDGPVVEPTSISIYPDEISLKPGETEQLFATVYPQDASQSVTWSVTSGSDVASVSKDGVVTAYKNGIATVTATTLNGLKATASVVVNDGATFIESIPPGLDAGQHWQCRVLSQGKPVTGAITWTSSNSSQISINQNGVLTVLVCTNEIVETTITATLPNGESYAYEYVTIPSVLYSFYTSEGWFCTPTLGRVNTGMCVYIDTEDTTIVVPTEVDDEYGFSYPVTGFSYMNYSSPTTEIVIPECITYIEKLGAQNLTKLTCLAQTPPMIEYDMTLGDNTVIYVPDNAVAAYKAASPWKNYRIEPLSGMAVKQTYSVYFVDSEQAFVYSPIYCYIWDAGDNNLQYTGQWPGVRMSATKVGYEDGWKYTFTTDLPLVKPMIIFNDGVYQTDDFTLVNNGIYGPFGKIGDYVGVESVTYSTESPEINGLEVTAAGHVEIYTLDGAKIAEGEGKATANVPGIYIIRAAGNVIKAHLK